MGSATFLGHTGCVKWHKGPKIANFKHSLSAPGQIGNIVVKNFQHVFRQLAQIRVSYYLNIGNFYCTNKFYGQKTKFGIFVFWALIFFLTLELKSVKSISSSFGKTVKRPINYFSRALAKMAPPEISRYLGPKSKKYTFCPGPNWQLL